MPVFEKHELVWAYVHTVQSALADPQTEANSFVVPVEHPELGTVKMVNSPVCFTETPCSVKTSPPLLGQHTEEVLLEFDYSWDHILKLKEEGTIP